MTETSPIIAVNKVGQNHPSTVGPKLDNIEVKLGDGGELLVRGPLLCKVIGTEKKLHEPFCPMMAGSPQAMLPRYTKTAAFVLPAALKKSL